MSSLAEKAKDEVQAFLEILIPSARSLRTNIKDQKALIKVKVKVLEKLEHIMMARAR
jgi:hypothetical protein